MGWGICRTQGGSDDAIENAFFGVQTVGCMSIEKSKNYIKSVYISGVYIGASLQIFRDVTNISKVKLHYNQTKRYDSNRNLKLGYNNDSQTTPYNLNLTFVSSVSVAGNGEGDLELDLSSATGYKNIIFELSGVSVEITKITLVKVGGGYRLSSLYNFIKHLFRKEVR